jgi:hypothetical protein
LTPSVISIVGFPRSGSTLLGDVLGSSAGAVHVGELAMLFRRAVVEPSSVCSCGATITGCPAWGPSVESALAGHGRSFQSIADDIDRMVGRRRVPQVDLVSIYRHLLREFAARTGASVLVDSSNSPSFGRLLGDASSGNIAYVHLVRDPRAATHARLRSGMQHRLAGSSRARRLASRVRDAIRWRTWNRDAARLADLGTVFETLTYERFADGPASALAALATSLSLELPIASGARVNRRRVHVVWGNRAATNGWTEVVRDDRWKSQSSPFHKRLVWTLTATEARRYGYR